MARWNLLSRSKSKKDTANQAHVAPIETTKQQPQITSSQEQPEEVPVMEYNEDLYAQSTPARKVSFSSEPTQALKQRTSWENPSTIEQNVDRIGVRKTDTVASNKDVGDQIEKKVDRLVAKKKFQH
jgi:hypothetical protein